VPAPVVVLAPVVAPAPVVVPAPVVNDQVARGEHGAVVSAERHATAVGLKILRQGGNAVDAAVAVALALSVTHPQAGNLGGGGFMVIRMADGRTAALDFRERAPSKAHPDMYLRKDGTVDPQRSLVGATAAGVPGSPAGLVLALEKFGSKRLKELAAPAVELAADGFVVDHFLAGALRSKAAVLGRFAATRAIFFRDGKPLQAGDRLVQGDLAGTLRRFGEGGVAGFYEGRTADLVVKTMAQDGGYVTAKDMRAYRPKVRKVLRGRYRGHEVLSMPPPSSGGVALIQMLNILEAFDVRDSGFGSSRTIHLLVESMRRAYADRARWLGDPDFYPVPVAGLVAKDYAAALRKGIRADKAVQVQPGRPKGAKESNDTTHFSVVDKDGNTVACTTTINSTFGSGLVVAGAGFLLNNEMDDFSAKPGVPNQFGLVGYEANQIMAHKRMLSSMTPTIVTKDDRVVLVLGSPGGGRIISTVLQVLLNVVDHRLPLVDAIRAPRVHHQWKPDQIFWERPGFAAEVRSNLLKMGHRLARKPRGIGRCQAIRILGDGTRVGVADPRSAGTALAY
jgi:gamma-glutamyltranspeptidase/glutathione hydrolase